MKIDFDSSTQQTKTELDEKFFTIADPAFIFDLLRNKIYSDPISAVCREITCNALDAQREVGKGNFPVKINLPSHQEPYFKVKDCGPGISPQRMDDIFLKYAASTKRNSNDQIGAFGIGAKSPFSYSDSFTIVTNHDGTCYNYAAFIDESRIGKLILLSETPTTEENGTEIIVPIKANDFHHFINGIEFATRHWQVKPIFTGGSLTYKAVNRTAEGNGWFVTAADGYYYGRKVKVLVGEIEYSVNVDGFGKSNIFNLTSGDIYLQFKVGEVSLAANRETIYLDPATKQAISDRLDLASSEFKQSIINKVNELPSLFDANVYVGHDLGAICNNIAALGKLQWNGFDIHTFLSGAEDFKVIEFTKKNYSDKIYKYTTSGIRFDKRSKIVMHDCGDNEPNNRHVKKFFEEDETIKKISLVQAIRGKDINEIADKYGFDQMNVEMLSKHNATIKAKSVNAIARLNIFRWSPGSDSFNLISLKEYKEDVNPKLVCYLQKDAFRNVKRPFAQDKVTEIAAMVRAYSKANKQVFIYGVDIETTDARLKQALGNVEFIDDAARKATSAYDKEYYLRAQWIREQNRRGGDRLSSYATAIKNAIGDDSLMKQYFKMQDAIKAECLEKAPKLDFAMAMGVQVFNPEEWVKYENDHMDQDIVALWEQVQQTYPMMKMIDYNYRYNNQVFIDYINLVDSAKK